MSWIQVMGGAAAMLLSAGFTGDAGGPKGPGPGPGEPKIADDVRSGQGSLSGIGFEVSQRFDRAWLVLHYRSVGPCAESEGDCELDAPVRVRLPGLTYDAAARAVVYHPAGTDPVVCATTKRGGFPTFRGSVASTGNCTYRTVKVDQLLDDGFDGRRDEREEVYFTIRRERSGRGG